MHSETATTGPPARERHEHQLASIFWNNSQGRASSASAAERFNDHEHKASAISIGESASRGAAKGAHHEHQLPSILRSESQRRASSASAAERFNYHKHKASVISIGETATRGAAKGAHHEHQLLKDATIKEKRPARVASAKRNLSSN